MQKFHKIMKTSCLNSIGMPRHNTKLHTIIIKTMIKNNLVKQYLYIGLTNES